MSTDICPVFQTCQDGAWYDIPTTWKAYRDFLLFQWLAGVRGDYWHLADAPMVRVPPLAAPKGFPPDFAMGAHLMHPVRTLDPTPGEAQKLLWMGQYAHTWLTAAEMLTTPLPQNIVEAGILTWAQYAAWGKRGIPHGATRVVWPHRGEVLATTPADITVKSTHVQVTWPIQMREALGYFLDEVHRLHDLYSNVRLICGFHNRGAQDEH